MTDAKSSLNPASVEFARSLEVESIPEKLRCATCNKLAIHAVKLGCCDSTICGECNDALAGDSCPVCEHSPFSSGLVSPAKGLQTTVKVFIKNEAKKRGIDLTGDAPKPFVTAAPAIETPPVAVATPALAETEPTPTPAVQGEAEAAMVPEEAAPSAELGAASEQELDTAPANGDLESAENQAQDAEQDEDDDDDDDDVVITTERPENEEQQFSGEGVQQYDIQANGESENTNQNMQMDQQQQQDFNNFNQAMNGFGNNNFGNMNMNGFNPMMGMPNFMGMPNMMGRYNFLAKKIRKLSKAAGMNMDPSMMFGGNFGGMGDMSAMMGMGMGNMGGGMSGMGDFNGMNGPGFFPNQGNYMQSQNFGNGPRSNDFYNNRGYGRGYGRGFGRGARGNQFGRGRGGWQYQQQQQFGNHNQSAQHQSGGPQQTGASANDVPSQRRGSPSYDAVPGPGADGVPAETGAKSHDAETNGDQDGTGTNQAGDETNATGNKKDVVMENGNEHDAHDASQAVEDGGTYGGDGGIQGDSNMADAPMQDASYGSYEGGMQDQQQSGHGHQALNNFSGRGGFRGRGGYGGLGGRGTDSTDLTPTPAPPVNAPTGPKAMREGKPNTGYFSRVNMVQKPTPTPAPQARQESRPRSVEPQKQEAPKQEAEYDNRGHSPSRPRSRHHDERYEQQAADDDHESDATYKRRKERERQKRKDKERRYDEGDRSDGKYRSRSESRTDDGSRRRHRDKEEDEYRSSRSHRDRSKDKHRSRRHRSRSPAKDYADDDYSRRKSKSDRYGDDYKDSRSGRKHSSRDDDYEYARKDKDRSSRSSKYERPHESRREPEPARKIIEPPSDELGFKIKGSKSARANKEKDMKPPTAPASASSDPYAEERARAQQNREAREAQRRLSTQSSSLGKRGRGDDDLELMNAPRGPKGDQHRIMKKGSKQRRISYKYEDEVEYR
ncbi:hypothetical protein AC578_3276 [Pseudocercospora eumusae]|uniref:RING-type domain-containing protein n=1 Tax=Pseudocercospora eumusae TaxID=321146 RepID=A0A139HCD6_9PEZI|nr:hypothetical protein AC578_3276 [Pseudocercospora eumusae]